MTTYPIGTRLYLTDAFGGSRVGTMGTVISGPNSSYGVTVLFDRSRVPHYVSTAILAIVEPLRGGKCRYLTNDRNAGISAGSIITGGVA